MTELTEEDIQRQLSADYITGPKYFLGKPLAKWTLGARDLIRKTAKPNDTDEFTFALGIYILIQLACDNLDQLLFKRMAVIRQTDDVENFRATASLWMDSWTSADHATAMERVPEIMRLAEAAEVDVTKKKEESEAEPIPNPTSSDSASSPSLVGSTSTESVGA